jgi:hypothetical protein
VFEACSWVCGLIYLVFLLLPNRCCCPIFSTLLTSNSNGTGHFFSGHIISYPVPPKSGFDVSVAVNLKYLNNANHEFKCFNVCIFQLPNFIE